MSYRVELSNGKVFSGLEMSGTCYVSKVEVKESDFAGGMRRVKVKQTVEGMPCPLEYELECAELGGVFKNDGEWYFWFLERSAEETARLKLSADVEYVAMMTGVEL